MLFFAIFIIILFSSCQKQELKPVKPVHKVKEQILFNKKINEKIEHLEKELSYLTDRVIYLEKTVNNLEEEKKKQYSFLPTKNLFNKKTIIKNKQIRTIPNNNISYYKEAMQHYQKKNYYIAQKLFNQFIKGRENLLTDDAKYWLAKIYIKQNNTKLAKEKLEELLIEYPATNKAPQILYSLIKLEKDDRIRKSLRKRLLNDYARTPEAKKLKMRKNALYN